MVPIRLIFRSRWAALIWAAGICLSAAQFAERQKTGVDAANADDSQTARASALAAEDRD